MILIRNDESRTRLPRELLESKAIIMTVQQSKGLEFDDVFLVDFFAGEPLLEPEFTGGGRRTYLQASHWSQGPAGSQGACGLISRQADQGCHCHAHMLHPLTVP